LVVYLLRKRTVEVFFVQSHDQTARTSPSTFPFLPSSQCQRADLGSLFRGRRQRKQGFLIFGNRTVLPVSRQHLCPILKTLGAATARPRRSALAGYMAGHLGCQHPKMTKPTKNEVPVRPPRKPRRNGRFRLLHPVRRMWVAVDKVQDNDSGDRALPTGNLPHLRLSKLRPASA